MFYSGQKVQCIDATSHDGTPTTPLAVGAVYVVAEFRPKGARGFRDAYAKLLLDCVELVGVRTVDNRGFKATRFRPLCEPKTDISIFHKALTGDLIDEVMT